jgi:hypothetical protein
MVVGLPSIRGEGFEGTTRDFFGRKSTHPFKISSRSRVIIYYLVFLEFVKELWV